MCGVTSLTSPLHRDARVRGETSKDDTLKSNHYMEDSHEDACEGESLSQKVKKTKRDAESDGEVRPEWRSENVFSSFKLPKVMCDSAQEKNILIHGKIRDQDGVVVLEKTAFRENTLVEMLTGSRLKVEMKNNIYTTYRLQPPPHLNEIKTTLMCPARRQHAKKYERRENFLVEETKEDYQSITLPYIQRKGLSLQWVQNILKKKAEAERIICEDPDPKVGFVLLPDIKWDQKQRDDLHLIAIVHRRGIKSLRDLTPEHLPLLQNIYLKGKEAILQRYGLPGIWLSVYLHYQPSYYHLHVHFTAMDYEVPGCDLNRIHYLTDVIQNLQSYPQYYKSRTLSFPVKKFDGLYCMYKQAKRL
ncbi:m7GpppX diphosphatase-like [Genypterus blacodes]|uniref:m7GpppX diphosphatase-like n=1 Tax=Genypterus blacodes TaxID=154954 RepID=UPI003F776970